MKLSEAHQRIHRNAVAAGKNLVRAEWQVISTLREVCAERVYQLMGRKSLYLYAVHEVGLSEPIAYAMAAIAKKSLKVPEILEEISNGRVSASKASRLLSVIDQENARELLDFASSRTTREIDRKVASINPKAKRRTSVRATDRDRVRVSMDLSTEEYALVERARELLGMKGDLREAVMTAVRELVQRKDPVARAERAKIREFKRDAKTDGKDQNVMCEPAAPIDLPGMSKYRTRTPIAAPTRHAVHLRDGGKCTFIHSDGSRCDSRHWLHIHHIREVSRGGTNDLTNLTTLCSAHHELIHQLSLPIDGELSRVRERTQAYVA